MNRTLAAAALAPLLLVAACTSSAQHADSKPAAAKAASTTTPNAPTPKVGDLAPPVTLIDAAGNRVQLTDYTRSGPLVLNFYRGNWCPYCNTALDEWDTMDEEFERAGATVIAVSPESLPQIKATTAAHKVRVLSDPDHAASKAFGLNFTLDDTTITRYKGYGIDLSKHNAAGDWDLPVPATFVIDRNGRIQYAYVNPDYKTRADPGEVLEVVERLN